MNAVVGCPDGLAFFWELTIVMRRLGNSPTLLQEPELESAEPPPSGYIIRTCITVTEPIACMCNVTKRDDD